MENIMLMQTLQADQLKARKAKDTVAIGLLTALVGEAAMVGKNAGNRTSTDEEVLATVRKFLKNAEETHARLIAANKDAAAITEEIKILKSYMPQQMTDDQLRAAISAIKDTNANANMGLVMKVLKEQHAGLYDGKRANEIAKEVLA